MKPTMWHHRTQTLVFVALLLAASTAHPATPASEPPGHWSPAFGPTGLSAYGNASAATVFDGDLVVAGSFLEAGRDSAANLARWDGTRWRGFGRGLSGVACLAAWNGRLYAGGTFRDSGLLGWDGQSWLPVSPALAGEVQALVVYRGALAVGGRFTIAGDDRIHNVALWDGATWQPLAGGVDGVGKARVLALAVRGDDLAVGGAFARAGGSEVRNLARWDGAAWSAYGAGTDDIVQALCYDGAVLYAGGQFRVAGDDSVFSVAAWDGQRWSALAGGLRGESWSAPTVEALLPWHGGVVVGGRFIRAGDVAVGGIATWNGTAWEATPPGSAEADRMARAWKVNTLTTWGDRLVVGGELRAAAEATINGLALWDGERWDPLVVGQGVEGYPSLRAVAGAIILDPGGSLAGPHNVRGTAVWGHDRWQTLTVATDDGRSFDTTPATMTERDGRVVAIGRLREGPPPSRCEPNRSPWHLAELRDRWHVISPALPGAKPACTGLLDFGGALVALGAFGDPEKPTEGAMIFDGAAWRPGGLDLAGGRTGAAVVAGDRMLVVVRHDGYVPGRAATFAVLEGDGHSWRSIRESTRADITALVNWGDLVVAGFALGDPDASESHHLQAWDGHRWSPLPGEFSYRFAGDGRIQALAVHEGHLIAAGMFRGVDGRAADNVAFLAGGVWRPLDGGVDAWVGDLGSSRDGLWLAGPFKHAGREPSLGVARWEGPLPVAVSLVAMPAFVPEARRPVQPAATSNVAAAAADTTTATLANGGFRAWGDDGLPRGWSWRTWCADSTAVAAAPTRLADAEGGVRLTSGREGTCLASLAQPFPLLPGRCYRLRARCDAQSAPPAGEASGWTLGFADYAHRRTGARFGPLHTGMEVPLPAAGGWAEVTLRADSTAAEGEVTIRSHGGAPDLVLREVVCDTVDATDAEVLRQVCAALRRRLVLQCDRAVAWDSLESAATARLQPAGARLGTVLSDLLTALDEPRLTLQSGHSDVQWIESVAHGKPLPESDGLPRERLDWLRPRLSDWQPYGTPTGWVDDAVAYVQAANAPFSARWLADLAGARGILLDLRGYSGQSGTAERQAENLRSLAAACAVAPRVWGYARPSASARAAVDTLRLAPAAGARLTAPVVCLIDASTCDAATECALMLKGLPGITLVGQPTRGGAGGSEKLPIPTGQQINFPARSLWDTGGHLVNDDHGVAPDLTVPPDTSPDPVFAAGLAVLREKIASGRH